MLCRQLLRRFTVNAEVKAKVFSAVRAYRDERKREIVNDFQAKGENATEDDKKTHARQMDLLSREVSDETQWKDFGFDGLDEVECLLTIEDAVGIRVPDADFHGVHGIEAALKIVEKYAVAK